MSSKVFSNFKRRPGAGCPSGSGSRIGKLSASSIRVRMDGHETALMIYLCCSSNMVSVQALLQTRYRWHTQGAVHLNDLRHHSIADLIVLLREA